MSYSIYEYLLVRSFRTRGYSFPSVHLLNKTQYTILRAVGAAHDHKQSAMNKLSFLPIQGSALYPSRGVRTVQINIQRCKQYHLCFPTEKALRAFEASASAKASQKNRALSRSILLTLCNGSNSTFVLPFYKKLLFFVSLNIISFFCFVSFFRITMRVYMDSYGNVFCCMERFC